MFIGQILCLKFRFVLLVLFSFGAGKLNLGCSTCYFKQFYLFEARAIDGIEDKTVLSLKISMVASFFFSELFCSQVAVNSVCVWLGLHSGSPLMALSVLYSEYSRPDYCLWCGLYFISRQCLFSYCSKMLVYLCLTWVLGLSTGGTSVF